MHIQGYCLKWFIYSFLCIVADILDATVSFIAPKKQREAQRSDVDELSDESIRALLKNATRLPGVGPAPVFSLTPGTVVKQSYPLPNETFNDCAEGLILNTLFTKTNIPVPCVRRIIKMRLGQGHSIIMDHIKGRTLAEVWKSYSLWQKIRVALTLRQYVRQLHRVKASHRTPPGPLSEQGPRKCDVPSIFGSARSMRGPFASYEELSEFFNNRFEVGRAKLPKDDPSRTEKFDDSSPLVLVHNDLNPRNIIVGDDGRLWIVDWEWSGFYPPWFEMAAMTYQVENEKLLGWYDRFWTLMIPFVCGPYFRQQIWLFKAGVGLYCT